MNGNATPAGLATFRQARELLESILADDKYEEFAVSLADMIRLVLCEEPRTRRPISDAPVASSSPEIGAAFEELFPPGRASIVDVLSLYTPDELEEALSGDFENTPEALAARRARLVERARLVREAEAATRGEA